VLERPGLLTFPTRGPSRYFGGDGALAERGRAAVRAVGAPAARGAVGGGRVGVPRARGGVADGRFAARCAARTASPDAGGVVEPGATPAFLAPWPVAALGGGRAALSDLLVRLGLPTLGAFAALPASAVLARFGTAGVRAHRLAAGFDEHATP